MLISVCHIYVLNLVTFRVNNNINKNLLRCNCAENPLITTEQFWYAPWKENINKLRRFVGFKVVDVVKYFSEKCIERDVYPA